MENTFNLNTQGLIIFFISMALIFCSIIVYGRYFSKNWIKRPDFNSTFYLLGIAAPLISSIMLINWETYGDIKYHVNENTIEDETIVIPSTVYERPKVTVKPPPLINKSLLKNIKEIILTNEESEIIIETPITDQDSYTPPPPPSYTLNAPVSAPKPIIEEEPAFITLAQDMPRFPGCEEGYAKKKEKEACSKQQLLKYIYDNLSYPAVAREQGIEGTVVLQFIINKNGVLSDIKTRRDIGAGCGDAATKVVENMIKLGAWVPGRQGGRAVNVLYTLPVRFKLQ